MASIPRFIGALVATLASYAMACSGAVLDTGPAPAPQDDASVADANEPNIDASRASVDAGVAEDSSAVPPKDAALDDVTASGLLDSGVIIVDASKPPVDAGTICDPNNPTYQQTYSLLYTLGGYTICKTDGTPCTSMQCCMIAPSANFPNMCLNK
jgi:hypothetical protein